MKLNNPNHESRGSSHHESRKITDSNHENRKIKKANHESREYPNMVIISLTLVDEPDENSLPKRGQRLSLFFVVLVSLGHV